MIYLIHMLGGWRRTGRALASLVGTIIGAGIFAVPYVMSRAGVGMGLIYILVMGIVIMFLHLYFGEIILAIRAKHRLPGFAGVIFGPLGKRLGAVLGIFGGWLGIIAYLILGGIFLSMLLQPFFGGQLLIYQLIFALLGALIVGRGLRRMGSSEIIFSSLLVIIILFLLLAGVPQIEFSNLLTWRPVYFFLPYGVIVFSLSGLAVIPELEDLLAREARARLRGVIIAGTVIAAILTGLFGLVVVGVSGEATSPDAISGLAASLGPWVIVGGGIFGFLAIITSYLTFLMNQLETFVIDYHRSRLGAWLLALGVPLALFLAGAKDFIQIIGLAGGFFGGLTALLLVAMYWKLKGRNLSWRGRWLPLLIGLIFFSGALVELVVFFRGY